jgi:N-acetylmuramoyl-L-alanine amidase
MNPRKIERIVVHTAATPEGRDIGAQEIDRWHRQRGWRMIGYHYVIRLDGTVEEGRDETIPGAHARGYNRTSIGICLIGGMDASNSHPKDTYTEAQYEALARLITDLKARYPDAEVLGHRDLPGVRKACPCFDVKPWWAAVVGARAAE